MGRRSEKARQKSLFAEESERRRVDEQPWDAAALLNFVRLATTPAAYWGTDRMTAVEQAAWVRDVGPILLEREVAYRVATDPRRWVDYDVWLAAYGRLARDRAARGTIAA